MIRVRVLGIVLALPAATMAAPSSKASYMGSSDRAQYNWVIHCQGCHGPEALGTPGSVPRLSGNVARFLHIKAGRAYLGRVPGVAFVALSNAEVAELLNWVVQRFDAEHVPKSFTPYSEQEIAALRAHPLISDAHSERQRILQSLSRR